MGGGPAVSTPNPPQTRDMVGGSHVHKWSSPKSSCMD